LASCRREACVPKLRSCKDAVLAEPELDGADHWAFAGDQKPVLASIKQFVGSLVREPIRRHDQASATRRSILHGRKRQCGNRARTGHERGHGKNDVNDPNRSRTVAKTCSRCSLTASCRYDMLTIPAGKNGFRGMPPNPGGEMRQAAKAHGGRKR
jgi:hypothetical protein